MPLHTTKPTRTRRDNRTRPVTTKDLRAYRAAWRDAWARRVASGAFAPEEEEHERRALLQDVAGVASSKDLDTDTHAAVMLALRTELGQRFQDPYRARKIWKIRQACAHIAHAREDADAYIGAILEKTNPDLDPAQWERLLPPDDLRKLMLTVIAQARAEGAKL